jgi:hypothetical protein
MPYADQVLDDQQLLSTVYEALTKRRPKWFCACPPQAHPQLEL